MSFENGELAPEQEVGFTPSEVEAKLHEADLSPEARVFVPDFVKMAKVVAKPSPGA